MKNKFMKKDQARSGKKMVDRAMAVDIEGFLSTEYSKWQETWNAQHPITQRFVEAQAALLAEAIVSRQAQVKFKLPDQLLDLEGLTVEIPEDQREQSVGSLFAQIKRVNLTAAVRVRLDALEASGNPGMVLSAGLMRYGTAKNLVYSTLPEGRSVAYKPVDGEEISTVPVERGDEAPSALMEKTDAIVETDPENAGGERGELLVPFVPAARRFFLPQWVAFDENDKLLVNSVPEAEASVESMQRFLEILHMAVSLAPYMVMDEAYKKKRYGILGQLVNQGRALARYETREMIEIIKRRAVANDLNRGLSLSLPFFDDQDLVIKFQKFEVIPAGRIMFVPAFVVRAAYLEQAKVAQDTRLSTSTRKHLLDLLRTLEKEFEG